ncbi:MAG: NUDIX domain-containing protein [Acidimicrobiales bacterium]
MTLSPHVAWLRENLGPGLLVLPSVTVLIERAGGEILFVRSVGSTTWSTLGGMVEPEERPADAAIRETKEETNLDIRLTGLAAVCGGPDCTVRYSNGDEVSYVTTVYRAEVVGGSEAVDGEEIGEIGWFSPAWWCDPDVDLDRLGRYVLAEIGLLPTLPGRH